MQRLPFNPEHLLSFFMTKENAGSLAGDLEERFQRFARGRGGCVRCCGFGCNSYFPFRRLLTHN
jgi:hypothetical protein